MDTASTGTNQPDTEDINSRIRNVVDVLNDGLKSVDKSREDYAQIVLTPQLLENIRIMLGFDKICFHCRQYKFKYELTSLEGLSVEVCQDCAEKIIAGDEQVDESALNS